MAVQTYYGRSRKDPASVFLADTIQAEGRMQVLASGPVAVANGDSIGTKIYLGKVVTARATTETGAANLALGHLGQPALADLAHDSNLRARACRLFFGGARDAILREKWWSFAKGWVTPAADTVESLGPLKTRYVMPADCVRVRYIDGVDDEEWDLESGDVEDSAGVTSPQTVLVTNLTRR
jgi:hypothetical protein